MKVAFVKHGTSFYAKVIRLVTWGAYSHSELVFSDGSMFSSDEADGGSRFIPGPKEGVEYDYLDVPMSAYDESVVKEFCEKEDRCKYDMRGIAFSFLPIPIGWQSAEKWFCSEVCAAALQRVGYLTGYTASSISPNKLYRLLGQELRTFALKGETA